MTKQNTDWEKEVDWEVDMMFAHLHTLSFWQELDSKVNTLTTATGVRAARLSAKAALKEFVVKQRDLAKAEAYAEVIKEVERVEWLSGKLKLYGISSSLKLKFLTK